MPRRKSPHPVSHKLGLRVRKLRKERGLSISKLAGVVGLSKGHMSSFERGLVNVTVGTVVRMAQALNTTPMHIMCVGDSELERVVDEMHDLPWDKQRELVAKVTRL